MVKELGWGFCLFVGLGFGLFVCYVMGRMLM